MTELLKQNSDVEGNPTGFKDELIPGVIDLTDAQQPFPELSTTAKWNPSPFNNKSPIFPQGETKQRPWWWSAAEDGGQDPVLPVPRLRSCVPQ